MNSLALTLTAAGWLGILTSISPCPLATNIAAISYLSRRARSRQLAVAGAVSYAFGRMLVYVLIGLFVSWGVAAAPSLSRILQNGVVPFVGPLLILVGLVLLGWIKLPLNFGIARQSTATKLAALGLFGEFVLGMLFALTFCPVSAALFFGTLLPLALASAHTFPVLALYGAGTALPVGLVAMLIALGLAASGKVLNIVQRWQGGIQTATASIIMLAGIWLTITASLEL